MNIHVYMYDFRVKLSNMLKFRYIYWSVEDGKALPFLPTACENNFISPLTTLGNLLSVCLSVCLIYPSVYLSIYSSIHFYFRERASTSEGNGQRERERILNRLHTQHRAQHRARSHNSQIMTWAKIKSQTLNWLSKPGAPTLGILNRLSWRGLLKLYEGTYLGQCGLFHKLT